MDSRFDDMKRARILVVDDNVAMRKAIEIAVEDEQDLGICGEASSISDALDQCRRLQPDLVLIDLSLNGENGLDLIRTLRECEPRVRTVVFSLHDEPLHINGAREAGARGYVIKSEGILPLLECARGVLDGHSRFLFS